MTLTLAEQLRSIPVRELSKGAGVGHQTAAHAVRDGKVRNGPAGKRIVAYLESLFGEADGAPANGEDLPGDLLHRKTVADVAKREEDARKAKRENDEKEGLLIEAEAVNARIAAAANEFRTGAETLRRDVLATVPTRARHRKAVREALDAGLDRLRERVAGALGG